MSKCDESQLQVVVSALERCRIIAKFTKLRGPLFTKHQCHNVPKRQTLQQISPPPTV